MEVLDMTNSDTTAADGAMRETPVYRRYRELMMASRPETGLTDEERGARGDRIASMVTGLIRLPSETLEDIGFKLAVVGDRLRSENHTVAAPFGALTMMLLASAHDDLARLAVTLGGNGTPGASQ